MIQIQIIGSRGTYSVSWSDYALLRDNVQNFLESGRRTRYFTAIHGIERAVDFGETVVDAARLRGELRTACYQLRDLKLKDSAVSLRTHALLTQAALLEQPTTTLAAESGWRLPVESTETRLLTQLRPLIADVLSATKTAVEGECVSVRTERVQEPNPEAHGKGRAALPRGERPMDAIVCNQRRSLHCDGFMLALLRDNVQHHLEGGGVSDRFLAIHSLANATWQDKPTQVMAGRLYQELHACGSQLAEIPIACLVASERTLSLRGPTPNSDTSATPGLIDPELATAASGANRLGEVFADLVASLTQLAFESPARSRLSVHAAGR